MERQTGKSTEMDRISSHLNVELHDVKVGHPAFGKTEGKVKSLRCDRPCIPTFAKRRRIWATRPFFSHYPSLTLRLCVHWRCIDK